MHRLSWLQSGCQGGCHGYGQGCHGNQVGCYVPELGSALAVVETTGSADSTQWVANVLPEDGLLCFNLVAMVTVHRLTFLELGPLPRQRADL